MPIGSACADRREEGKQPLDGQTRPLALASVSVTGSECQKTVAVARRDTCSVVTELVAEKLELTAAHHQIVQSRRALQRARRRGVCEGSG